MPLLSVLIPTTGLTLQIIHSFVNNNQLTLIKPLYGRVFTNLLSRYLLDLTFYNLLQRFYLKTMLRKLWSLSVTKRYLKVKKRNNGVLTSLLDEVKTQNK